MKSWLIYIINASLVSYYIGYKLWRQLLDIVPVLLLSTVAFAISYIGGGLIQISLYVDACIMFLVFVTVYVTSSVFFKMEAYILFYNLVNPHIRRIKDKLIK
jgi:hypothetical protein